MLNVAAAELVPQAPNRVTIAVELRPFPVFRRLGGASDMHESGNSFIRGKSKCIEHTPIIGIPLGDPARGIAHRMRGNNERHCGSAGRKLLLPFRNFHVRAGPAHDGDDERRARQPLALEVDLVGRGIGAVGAKCGSDRLTRGGAGLAFEQDESPGRQLAVIGDPRGDFQKRFDLGCASDRGRPVQSV